VQSNKAAWNNKEKGKYYMFSEKLKQEIKAGFIQIGMKLFLSVRSLHAQNNFLVWLSIDTKNKDNISTGKKIHEMFQNM